MDRKRFLLLIGVFLALAIFARSQQGTVISTDKDSYSIGETVYIRLNSSELNNSRLDILNLNRKYSFLNPQNQIRFTPKESGRHIIELFHSDHLVDRSIFSVGIVDAEESQAMQIDTTAKITTDKTLYGIGEPVIITTDADSASYKIVLNENSRTYTFFNLKQEIQFFPSNEGDYTLILVNGDMNVSETAFRVIGSSEDAKDSLIAETMPKPSSIAQQNRTFIKVLDRHNNELESHTLEDAGKIAVASLTGTTVEIKGSKIKKLDFKSLDISKDQIVRIDDIDKQILVESRKALSAFAIDPSKASFLSAEVTATAIGTELWKCKEWNFEDQLCYGSWAKVSDITPGVDYTFILTAQDPGFAETGVASINSRKPIYSLNETAQMLIVVLDTRGYLADADVQVIVQSPAGYPQEISPQHISSGIYQAEFADTGLVGEYELSVYASGSGVNSTMRSSFQVKEFYEFDILRDTPITVDPWQGPFESRITLVSHNYTGLFNFTEVIPNNYTLYSVQGAEITQTQEKTYILWSNLSNNSIVSYQAYAPLLTPELFLLGPSYINFAEDVFYEARPWYMALDPTYDAGDLESGTYTPGSGGGTVEYSYTNTIPPGSTITNITVSVTFSNANNKNGAETFTYKARSTTGIDCVTVGTAAPGSTEGTYAATQTAGVSTCVNIGGTSYLAISWPAFNHVQDAYSWDVVTITVGYIEPINNAPNVTSLNNPPNQANISINPVDFNFTAIDDSGLANCSVFMNISGWTNQGTVYSITNNTNTKISKSLSDGSYKWNIQCFDNALTPKNAWYSSNYTFSMDSTKPNISNLLVTPGQQLINLPLNMSVFVSDAHRIDKVIAYVTLPNASLLQLAMEDKDSDKIYNLTFPYTNLIGNYNFTIIANDSFGNFNLTESNFNISLDTLSLLTDKSDYVVDESVIVNAFGFYPNANITLTIFDPTHDPVTGYPKNITSNLTGGINATWTIPPGQTLGTYIINTTDTSNSSRSVSKTIEIVSAIITAEYSSYEQGTAVNITGYNWDNYVNVTINITGPSEELLFGPINFSTNSSGGLNLTWFLPYDASIGTTTIRGYEPGNPAKFDDYTFSVTARTITLAAQFPWYKAGERVNITGSGFSPGRNISIEIFNLAGNPISGYPKNVTSNSSGG
ncbi:MAG: hypothetical protein ABIJ34_04355, partial [archaeon]